MYREILAVLIAASTLVACAGEGRETASVTSRSTGGPGIDAPIGTVAGPLSERGGGFSSAATLAGAGINDRVFFAYDRWDLDAAAQQALRQQAEWLRAHPGALATIEGHADERGTREYNLALGDRRAATVRSYLIAAGVPADRLRTVSYGKEHPAAVGSSETFWAQNRRAVTVTP